MKLIKRRVDEIDQPTITIEYSKWDERLEELVGFICGSENSIAGYGENREMHHIRLNDILYFEAVGELVFAYTKSDVYEIKMRLYQVEEMAKNNAILRASKSILINLRKIDVLKPALNGRMYATMENGEELLISRSYSKSIASYIKSA